MLVVHAALRGKKPSHGPAAVAAVFSFRFSATSFLGLFSPVAAAITLTTAFNVNASVGRVRTGSRHVGHVY